MKNALYLILVGLTLYACSSSPDSNPGLLRSMVYSATQMDEANLAEHYRGSAPISDLNAEYKTTPNNAENRKARETLEKMINQYKEIDEETALLIQQIEELKMVLLKEASVDTKQVKNQDSKAVIWRPYNAENTSLPSKLNLAALDADQLSLSVEHLLVSNDPATLTDNGKKLWDGLQNLRMKLVNTTAHYPFSPNKKPLKFSAINQFDNPEGLRKKVRVMIEKSGANIRDDGELLIDLYCMLTKPEYVQDAGQKTHWINQQFEGANLVSALLTLSSLENEVLQARSLAINHIASKMNYCGPGLDQLVVLTQGPNVALQGEEIALNIMFATTDWRQPTIEVQDIESMITYNNGIGTIRFKPQSGTQTIRGNISFANNLGVKVIRPWEWKVRVIEKP